jgi:glyoxylase-like metal-dependent hydrolase (beta-lactamase superfamily II)
MTCPCGHALSRRQMFQVGGLAAAGLAAGTLLAPTPAGAQMMPQLPQVTSDLTRVAEDVYMWRIGGYNSMIVVTDEGAIVFDPISLVNPRASTLLKAVVASLTDQPVKYVVYSHDHADHNTGGNVFADTAEFVGHRLAAPKIAARNDARSPVPTVLVDERMTLRLGGKEIELIYAGRNHSDNSLVSLYPARDLAFMVDFVPVRSLPFRTLNDTYLDEYLASLRWIEDNVSFTTLIPGHGNLGTKANVGEVRGYLVDLIAAVEAARRQGLPDNSDQMTAAVRAALQDKYGMWAQFGPFLPENIQGIIRLTSGA